MGRLIGDVHALQDFENRNQIPRLLLQHNLVFSHNGTRLSTNSGKVAKCAGRAISLLTEERFANMISSIVSGEG